MLPWMASSRLQAVTTEKLFLLNLLVRFLSVVLFSFNYKNPVTWIFIMLYFVTAHLYLVFCEAMELAYTIVGKPFRYLIVWVGCLALEIAA